ncbi:MAG: peptidoglycan DD-metalloendopeptidase family protein [Limnospira sp. PMC 1291.21]|uniref:Peptidase M23 n=3 Tax=Limnospira TaxID=2596745 RepID=A0A9P1KIG3_9CYAN|nr:MULTISPECIES: peptidoglycan DD-metalloendopeptidase family protein [Limnospira]MDC0836118.1 peptidoglycan DD-metalloendopeptidase family protein [Limnoraphis robusta]MDY7054865.1 peptidoglycan DD-metalloendopeptidase family protein [Limnospira fusiformis LS22]QJB25551.1 peptidoglycan DD-metalloendopeptidase family protein [Limnospira fusiformis SAG 85.79]EDZ96337.1 Peptidase M23 [Limnospira maxima CS-328]MDT9179210.1 peptidoglycan DD-metalloendopeptidase family protein [Limnospira sp. PMC 1
MKGTVPHNNQPVVTDAINTDMNVETTQQVTAPSRSKVKTSAAFLGLAIASGLLFPEGGSAATESLKADSTKSMQSSSNQAALNQDGDSVSDSSDWQPSILRNLTESNSGSMGSATPVEPAAVIDHQENETQAQEQAQPGSVVVSEPSLSKSEEKPFPYQFDTIERFDTTERAVGNGISGSDSYSSDVTENTAPSPRFSQPSQVSNAVRETIRETDISSFNRVPGTLVIDSDPTQSVSVVYKVSSGDTIARIAEAHGVSVDDVIRANNLTDPHLIKVDQELRIPKRLHNYLASPRDSYTADHNLNNSRIDLGSAQTTTPSHRASTNNNTPGASVRLRLSQTVTPTVLPSQISGDITKPVGLKVDLGDRLGTSNDGGDRISPRKLSELSQQTPVIESNYTDNSTTASRKDLSTSGESQPSSNGEFSLADAEERRLTPLNRRHSGSRLYSDRLRTEIERLRNEYHAQQSQPTYSYQTVSFSQEPEEVVIEAKAEKAETADQVLAATEPNPRRLQRINPEFNPTAYQYQKDIDGEKPSDGATQEISRRPEPGSEDNPNSLVATAPLGASAYDPLQNPTLGRIVSPDLPPLLGPDAYLPGGSTRFAGYIWPAEGILTSGYGWRWGRMHRGIDIAGPVGTPILAAAPGVVIFSGWNSGGYGNLVELEHPDGSVTLYAHNHRNLVSKGQKVTQGQLIAEMGSTGFSTGPHLHFEIHPTGNGAVNPMALLSRD